MTMRWLKVMLLTMTTGMAAHGAVTKAAFGTTPDGKAVDIYTLKSDGIEARIMTYGARIVSIKTPDRDGKMANVVLGYNSLEGYLADKKTYFGAIVGRYGNRIAHGSFKLEGKTYQMPKNDNGINSLHGGTVGFDKLVWQATRDSRWRGDDAGEQGRRPGLSGHADGACAVHAAPQRAAHRLQHVDRQGHGGEPDEPLVLQPRRARAMGRFCMKS